MKVQGFLGQVPLVGSRFSLGQITDPAVLAKVDMAEAFANALTAVSKIAQVPPKSMAASPEAAAMTFDSFMNIAGASALPYTMKLLVLASALVKQDVRALGMEPQELSNILMGAQTAVKKRIPEENIPAELKKYQEEIISRASPNAQAQVRALIEGSGISAKNLVPNVPKDVKPATPAATEPQAMPMAPATGLTDIQKAALVGIPLVVLVGIGLMIK